MVGVPSPDQTHSELTALSRRIDEQTRYFEAILSSISDFAYTFDRAGRFVFVNQALLDLWGLKLEEALGKNFYDLNYPDELAGRLQRQIEEVYSTAQRVTDETSYTSPSGVTGYYEYIFSPYFSANGTVELVVGTTRNITDRKLADEAIRQLSERNREILESITDAFFAIDDQWRFTYVNRQAEQMLGRDPGDLIGRVIWDIYPGLVGTEFEAVYRRTAKERVPLSVKGFYPDHQRWYDVNVFPALSGITLYFKNVTERIEADEILRLSEAETERQRRLLETFLSNTPDLAYVFDLDHRFTYANEALLKMWGKTWDEAIGKNCLELGYEPWHAEMHDREIEEVVATKGPLRGEVPFTGTNGRRVYDYIFVPVFDASGEVEAVAGTTRDITDREHVEETLREADRRKDEFLATLAHELRNPLAPIRSGLEILRRAADDPAKVDETLAVMERQTNQIVHLVDDLLDISRITQGKINLKVERLDLLTALGIALESTQGLIDESGNELILNFPSRSLQINGDLTRIAQIFLNILNNAAKYSEPGGRISLTVAEETDYAAVTIQDTGLGIPPDMLPRIFDLFGQVESPLGIARGGLGIGLSVVKKLVEMHGGTVEVFSDGPGTGSTFTVRLPLAPSVEKVPEIPESESYESTEASRPEQLFSSLATEDLSGLRVLVVDDNRDALEMMGTLLSLEGHAVRTALDGRSGLAVAEQFRPEVCLCDIGLPEMNGYELAVKLREMLPEARLISISGWGRDEDKRRSLAAGFNYHLVKPVQLEDVLELLTRSEP